jgi:hypothetical protein
MGESVKHKTGRRQQTSITSVELTRTWEEALNIRQEEENRLLLPVWNSLVYGRKRYDCGAVTDWQYQPAFASASGTACALIGVGSLYGK